jgi:hypothetical protein
MRLMAMRAKAVAIRLHATPVLVRRISLKAIIAAKSWKVIALPIIINIRTTNVSFAIIYEIKTVSIPALDQFFYPLFSTSSYLFLYFSYA